MSVVNCRKLRKLSALYWRLATFAPKDYHRRNYVSLPCSEWERVFPQRRTTRTGGSILNQFCTIICFSEHGWISAEIFLVLAPSRSQVSSNHIIVQNCFRVLLYYWSLKTEMWTQQHARGDAVGFGRSGRIWTCDLLWQVWWWLTWLRIFSTQNQKAEEKVRLTTTSSTGALPCYATLRHKSRQRTMSTFQFSNFGHKRKR